jgi:hypothetical protein
LSRLIAWEAGAPERRFTVGGSAKSVARCHRTVLAYWKFESISLQRRVNKLSVPLKTTPVGSWSAARPAWALGPGDSFGAAYDGSRRSDETRDGFELSVPVRQAKLTRSCRWETGPGKAVARRQEASVA